MLAWLSYICDATNLTNHVDLAVYIPKGSTTDRKEQAQLTKWETSTQKRTKNVSLASSNKANPFLLLNIWNNEHFHCTFYGCHASLFFMFGKRFYGVA